MKKYGLGIIGAGGYGKFCIRAYQAMPEVDVVGIAAVSEEEATDAAKEFNIPFATADYIQLLARNDVDVVAIITPPYLHAEMAIAAARAGKSFICEKPLATTLEDAKQILDEVKKNNVKATIGYVMRYTDIYQKVAEIAREGRFGNIKRILFENYASRERLSNNHWIWDEKKSGGLLVEHGVHFFDIFSMITQAEIKNAGAIIKGPEEVLALVEYQNGIIGSFFHLFDRTIKLERNFANIIFERGYARVKGWIPLELHLEWEDGGEIKQEKMKIEQTKEDYYRQLTQDVLRDLLSQMDNPSHVPKVSLDDAINSLKIAITAKENSLF